LKQLQEGGEEEGRPIKKIEDVAAKIIALAGNGFRGLSILKVSEIKSKDKIQQLRKGLVQTFR
jgi:hypothetical protein